MLSLLMLLIVLEHFKISFAAVTCNPNNKIPYGRRTDIKSQCERNGGCWENDYGCYFSLENISGFRMMIGECTDCSVNKTMDNVERRECSRECLKRPSCNCFIYNSNSKVCQLINDICHSTNFLNEGKITYNKYASKKLVCGYGSCYGGILGRKGSGVNECWDYCEIFNSCKMIASVSGWGLTQSKVCVAHSIFCNFALPENAHMQVISCIPGPAFSDWTINHDNIRKKFFDNSNATCETVSSEENFNLKFPWPAEGSYLTEFKISIVGKNLMACMNPLNSLKPEGLIAYVNDEFQIAPKFIGHFKSCQLMDGDDTTHCRYSCSCNGDYCEAVHLRVFSSEKNLISLCNYKIEV